MEQNGIFELVDTEIKPTITKKWTIQIHDPELKSELGSIVFVIDTMTLSGEVIETVYRSKNGYELNYDNCSADAMEVLEQYLDELFENGVMYPEKEAQ
jgi:hypothetical protein